MEIAFSCKVIYREKKSTCKMGQSQTKYATDDPELVKMLKSVMGNTSAANLFWSCLLDEPIAPFELPIDLNEQQESHSDMENEDIGKVVEESLRIDLDKFCLHLGVSRFVVILCVFAILMDRYCKTDEFVIHHNYGVTGSKFRILKSPVTKVNLSDSLSFTQFVIAQNNLIQKSSYHLCLPKLPIDWEPDNFFGVFLHDTDSGHLPQITSSLSLVIQLDSPTDISLKLFSKPSIFSSSFARDILDHFYHSLENCLQSPTLPLRQIPTCSSSKESEILEFLNPVSNIIQFPELEEPLHALIVSQSLKTPWKIAVQQFGSNPVALTYFSLVKLATSIALQLNAILAPGSKVAILLPRGVNQVVAILAILLAGCAYVPLDAESHPPDRIDFVLRDAEVGAIISESSVAVAKSFASKFHTIMIDKELLLDVSSSSLDYDLSRPQLCYVIYTSGSTGNPKGVLVPHRGVVNDIFCVYRKYLKSDPQYIENVCFSTNICFDAHVDEVFLPLVFGGTISALHCSIASDEGREILTNNNFSFVQATPSVLTVVDLPSTIKVVLIGGEALTKNCIAKIVHADNPPLILNGYGPTETTNESSINIVSSIDDFKSIGSPIWNTQFYIRNGSCATPIGGWGELYIGGIGVTKGYQNLPKLTSSSFLDGGSIYKTGDIVRINRETRRVDFKGRETNCGQIKLRGYRIELGEIREQILANNNVSDCHVVFDQNRIGVYLQTPGIGALQYGLLPEYMHPTVVCSLSVFPRNLAGKLDTKRLPAFGQKNAITPSDVSGLTQIVMNAFAQCLNRTDITIESNFFASGGNSLNVIQLQSLIFEKTKRSIKLQSFFQLQSVASIVKYLDKDTIVSDDLFISLSVSDLSIPPLLCIHAAGGQVHTYAYLASRLAHVVGVQDPALTSSSLIKPSFEKMAANYANRINKEYSQGPIFLAGHSSGGSLAFETGKLLENKYNRYVANVFMFDTDFPTLPTTQSPNTLSDQIERIDEIRHYLYHGWKEGLMHDYVSSIAVKRGSLGAKLLKVLKALLPSNKESEEETQSLPSADLLSMISLLDHHLQIEKKYLPAGPLVNFDMVLFRHHAHSAEPSEWQSLTNGRAVVVDVPDANHYNIIRPPAVDILATVIQDILQRSCAHSRITRIRE